MDLSTGLGLVFGLVVLATLILMGGDLGMFLDVHACIVIFGGATAATLIRFPLSSLFHGMPLGMKFAFTMRRWTPSWLSVFGPVVSSTSATWLSATLRPEGVSRIV